MRAALQKLWRLAAPSINPVLTIPIVVLMHQLHHAGRFPVWAGIVALLLIGTIQRADVQLAIAGHDWGRRLWLRTGLHLAAIAGALYVFGWGPAFTVSFAIGGLMHLRWSGPQAWRPVAVWMLVLTTIGQALVHFQVVFSYVPPRDSHAIAFLGTILAALFTRQYALAMHERRQVEQDAENRARRFSALVQNSSDITVVVDRAGLINYISPVVEQQLGYRPEELLGTRGEPYLAESERQRVSTLAAPLWAQPGGTLRLEVRLRHRDGSERWYDVSLLNLLHDPAVEGIVINQRDVTEQRAANDRLAYDASHDPVTGLPNRRAFLAAMEQELLDCRAAERTVGVLYLDLDGFKKINDVLGHEVGDAVLAKLSELLRRCVLGGDIVGRLGGDEFAAVLRNVNLPEQAVAVARRILDALAEPLEIGRHHLRVNASIGIALAGSTRDLGASLLHRADLAMYTAKRRGTGGWVIHAPELEISSEAITRQDLLDAITDGQLRVQYQPIVELATGRAVAVEALVRWHHPRHGLVPPGEFLPAAEQNGAISAIGDWVAQQACRNLKRWRETIGPEDPFSVTLNVSPRQLELPGTTERLTAIFAATGVRVTDVIIEVAEGALVAPPARESLNALAGLGALVAVDDFGTGYSSLQYLIQLPIKTLKLDRSFTWQLNGSTLGSAIPSAVASLARTLQLDTVAEGVETPEQAAELLRLGYKFAQGFLYARPLNEDDVDLLLRTDRILHGSPLQLTAAPV